MKQVNNAVHIGAPELQKPSILFFVMHSNVFTTAQV